MDTGKIDIAGLSEGDALLAVSRSAVAMVLTDLSQPDNPGIHVNDAFERIAGYSADAAVGRNCRFSAGQGHQPARHRRVARRARGASRDGHARQP